MSDYTERQRHWAQLRARQAADAEHRARTADMRRDLEIERLRALYADTPDIPREPREPREGRKWTPEQRARASRNADRERLSRQSRAWWREIKRDTARYEAMCRRIAQQVSISWTPERRAQWSEYMRQKWASGEWEAAHRAAMEARWTSERRAEQAEQMAQIWANPALRAERSRKIRCSITAAHRAEQAERARKMWTPERRARWSERMRAQKLAEAAADPRPARAAAMREQGALIREIAETFGVAKSTVTRWLKREMKQ